MIFFSLADQEIGRIAQHLHTAAYTAQRHGVSVDRTRIIHLFGEGQDVDLRAVATAGRNYDRIGRQFKQVSGNCTYEVPLSAL